MFYSTSRYRLCRALTQSYTCLTVEQKLSWKIHIVQLSHSRIRKITMLARCHWRRQRGRGQPVPICAPAVCAPPVPGQTSRRHFTIPFLPARRYASAGNSDRNVSVCPSVCLSVTRRYCVKTKKASGMISSVAPRL